MYKNSILLVDLTILVIFIMFSSASLFMFADQGWLELRSQGLSPVGRLMFRGSSSIYDNGTIAILIILLSQSLILSQIDKLLTNYFIGFI